MRPYFAEPEKSLIAQLSVALEKIEATEFKPNHRKEKEAMRNACIAAQNKIVSIENKYPQPSGLTEALCAQWQVLIYGIAVFAEKLTEIETTFSHYLQQMPRAVRQSVRQGIPEEERQRIRQVGVGDFIANISALEGDGAAGAAVFAGAARNAVSRFLSGGELSVAAELGQMVQLHDAAVANIQAAREAGVSPLAADLDQVNPNIAIMHANQNAAVARCTAAFKNADEKTHEASALEASVIDDWEKLSALFDQVKVNKKQEIARFNALEKTITDLVAQLHQLQKKIKHPPTDFDLNALMHRILFETKDQFQHFKRHQRKLRELIKQANQIANASPPASPVSSQASSGSSSSFWSSSRSSGSARSSANSDYSESDADDEEDQPPRKRARI